MPNAAIDAAVNRRLMLGGADGYVVSLQCPFRDDCSAFPVIASGSHTVGVSAADFGLPVGTALRYERPAAALRHLFTSYAVLDSEPEYTAGREQWMLPSWAQIWIVMTDAPISVGIGNRRYDPLASAIVYGVTSRAMPVRSNGGVTIAIDVSPLGWARFFDADADALRDRIAPLHSVLPSAVVAELVTRLNASDQALEVKGIIDDVFTRNLPPPHPDEARISALLEQLFEGRGTVPLGSGSESVRLRRLSKRYFGFPPKTLQMRARFLHAFIPMLVDRDRPNTSGVAGNYYDGSHFLRDAARFLGMTPRQFLQLDTAYLTAALRARTLVAGHPTASLDPAAKRGKA